MDTPETDLELFKLSMENIQTVNLIVTRLLNKEFRETYLEEIKSRINAMYKQSNENNDIALSVISLCTGIGWHAVKEELMDRLRKSPEIMFDEEE